MPSLHELSAAQRDEIERTIPGTEAFKQAENKRIDNLIASLTPADLALLCPNAFPQHQKEEDRRHGYDPRKFVAENLQAAVAQHKQEQAPKAEQNSQQVQIANFNLLAAGYQNAVAGAFAAAGVVANQPIQPQFQAPQQPANAKPLPPNVRYQINNPLVAHALNGGQPVVVNAAAILAHHGNQHPVSHIAEAALERQDFQQLSARDRVVALHTHMQERMLATATNQDEAYERVDANVVNNNLFKCIKGLSVAAANPYESHMREACADTVFIDYLHSMHQRQQVAERAAIMLTVIDALMGMRNEFGLERSGRSFSPFNMDLRLEPPRS